MSRSEILKIPTGEIYIRGISFSSFADVERQIEDAMTNIDYWKSQLKMLAVATPKDITPGNEPPIEYVEVKVNDIMDALEDEYDKLNILRFARGIITDYSMKYKITNDESFMKLYVDKYLELRSPTPKENNRI